MNQWAEQRNWESVEAGDQLTTMRFPLTLHRLIVEAGANKDFAAIHTNSDWAKSKGASEMFANNVFLQAMWERVVREYIGLAGTIRRIGPFRMSRFTTVGEVVEVSGTVARKWADGDSHLVEISMSSRTSVGETMRGSVLVTLPTAADAKHN